MKTHIALAAAAIALSLPVAAFASNQSGYEKWQRNWNEMACTSLTTEFREALPFHGAAKDVAKARHLAEMAKEDCSDHAYRSGAQGLETALLDIGAAPQISQADPPE